MQTRKIAAVKWQVAALLAVLLSTNGCASNQSVVALRLHRQMVSQFDARIEALFDDLSAGRGQSVAELVPAAVMPGSLRKGGSVSRLEETVMERLTQRLRRDREVLVLSRQNWFEYREEGRPLSNVPGGNLTVYEVMVDGDDILQQARIRITATDASGKGVPGVSAQCVLDLSEDDMAMRLYKALPSTNPFPEGLEEHPYVSLDRMAFSLASELADAYGAGNDAPDRQAANDEVLVQLSVSPETGVSRETARSVARALQQAVVGYGNFTCVLSREDFARAFRQIDFYNTHRALFDLEESKLAAGTVLLMADISRRPGGKELGVALRAIWRVGPLADRGGNFIATNRSGTYVSGFTAKGYVTSGADKTTLSAEMAGFD